MLSGSDLPAVNACLNSTATILLLWGWRAIRSGQREKHAFIMRAATCVSAVFLACYLYYHFAVIPEVGHTKFNREGILAWAYYGMLISHVLLAMAILPMVLRTLWLAHKEDWERHKRLARWTMPIWLYVSFTGVAVYVVLYHLNPPL